MCRRKRYATSLRPSYITRQILFILGIALVLPPQLLFSPELSKHYFASAFIIIGNFITEEDFKACKYNLNEADTIPPIGYVDGNEYAKFISLWTSERMDRPFSKLPFQLIVEFQLSAEELPEGDKNLGDYDNVYIPTTDESDEDDAYLSDTCSSIRGILNIFVPPTSAPTINPTQNPTLSPESKPSASPSSTSSVYPTVMPTVAPSSKPSSDPTTSPSKVPTSTPSVAPTSSPSYVPTYRPSTSPSVLPSSVPSMKPSGTPSIKPSSSPSQLPSSRPTSYPTNYPSMLQSALPSTQPTTTPTDLPSHTPSIGPSFFHSSSPSLTPSSYPSSMPSSLPTIVPSLAPSTQPSKIPSSTPSSRPSSLPTNFPSNTPTSKPSYQPSHYPSRKPSVLPTKSPSQAPSNAPSDIPSVSPSEVPSSKPTMVPTVRPSAVPSIAPSSSPTISSAPTRYGRVDAEFSYRITTDEGVEGPEIMSGEGNTVANDLIFATTVIVNRILDDSEVFGGPIATYYDDYPVAIKSAITIRCRPLIPGSACVVIKSCVTVFADRGENLQEIKQLIFDGIDESFQDGSFADAIPN